MIGQINRKTIFYIYRCIPKIYESFLKNFKIDGVCWVKLKIRKIIILNKKVHVDNIELAHLYVYRKFINIISFKL